MHLTILTVHSTIKMLSHELQSIDLSVFDRFGAIIIDVDQKVTLMASFRIRSGLKRQHGEPGCAMSPTVAFTHAPRPRHSSVVILISSLRLSFNVIM